MKIQHVAFLLILCYVFWKRNAKTTVAIGLIALLLSIPLFARHIFFTAEVFTWYAAAFFLVSIFFQI